MSSHIFASSSSSSYPSAQASPVPTYPSTTSFSAYAGRPPYASPNPVWTIPANWNLQGPVPNKKPPRIKKRTAEEEDITKRTAARVAARLALDHAAVLEPNTETPFADYVDVVNRLLPYHVFHQPREDLDRKGKGKADDLKAEIQETKFALECFRRKRKLEARFRRAKTRSGKLPAPDDQAVVLAQAVLEAERAETALISSEVRAARAELDKIERDKRANNARLQQAAVPQYYRAYAYPYAQQPYGQTGTTTVFSAIPATGTTAIPVQIPVSSLPALHALGIQPVAATSLVPGAPPPPAVLRGSSENGTVLNLEINIGLLQTAQRNGLALVVNSLIAATPTTVTPVT